MTLPSETSSISYAIDGVTTDFAFPYYFLLSSDLVVSLITVGGETEVQVLDTDYSVSGAGEDAGGTVTFTAAPDDAAHSTLIIERAPPATQLLSLSENDPLPPAEIEKAFDKVTMLAGRNRDLNERAIRVPVGETGFTLPTAAARAGTVPVFSSDGLSIEVGPDAGDIADAQANAAAAAAAQVAAEAAQAAAEAAAGEAEAIADLTFPIPDYLGGTGADTPAGARANLEAATNSQAWEYQVPFGAPANGTYIVLIKSAFEWTITEVVSKCTSGTCTVQVTIDGVALGGTANSVSSVEQAQPHASANVVAAGTDVALVITSVSSCIGMIIALKGTRVLA